MAHSLLPALQALLFTSGEPQTFTRLGKILGISKKEISEVVMALQEKLANDGDSGLMLIQNAESVELATKGEHQNIIEELTKSVLQEDLSKAALEVLSIVSYRAPVTRAEIESIRGVNCSFTLRNLLLRGLIDRKTNPEDTREYIYTPSFLFLEKLGLSSVNDLPEFATLSQDERLSVVAPIPEDAPETPQ